MADLKTGTITKYEEKLSNNGYHESFEKEGKKFYAFSCDMDNGDSGASFSTDSQGKYKKGDRVKYEYADGKKGKIIRIKSKADAEGNSTGYKSDYNDPVSIQKQAMVASFEISQMAYELSGKQPKERKSVYSYATQFYDWIIKDVTKRDEAFNKIGCLKRAMEMAKFTDLGMIEQGKTIANVFAAAEEMLTIVNSIKGEDKPV